MKFDVRLSREARADILRNMVWWGEIHSPVQAIQWEAKVREQLKSLSEMPERLGFAAENENSTIELRQMMVGLGQRPTYRAIYTVTDAFVHILAVRRASQDEFVPE